MQLAKNNEAYLIIADLHTLTTIQNKALLSHNIEVTNKVGSDRLIRLVVDIGDEK